MVGGYLAGGVLFWGWVAKRWRRKWELAQIEYARRGEELRLIKDAGASPETPGSIEEGELSA